ncbi:phage tail protein [Dyella tabacisoli]|uniref:Phage tail protein n=1 Tax=Dyella tabacisoli TaxID=2282381 RepID=A0A369UL65_9GAMM|nr:tail fiber protein [Dyella tabacisoli]RDD81073.1 phage tail protein [Dyella tabacisoli]
MSTPYVGEIRLFGFQRVPDGWFACDGSLKSIAEYQVLFQLIGTTYGGDGQTTFSVPDLSGRVPLHWGRGNGLTPRVIGERSGTETVTLIAAQMPAHTHALTATTNGSATTPGPTMLPGAVPATDTMYATDLTGSNTLALGSASIDMQGNSLPHDNTMPTLTVSYCIAWAGIYPSQS